MIKTRITQLLGINYPIIQGGMQYVAYPKLAAAISNAGGLGTVNATNYDSPSAFHQAIKEMKTLTEHPFCVNINLLPDANVGDDIYRYIDICQKESVTAIETAGAKPDKLAPMIHQAGIIHIHKVAAIRYGLSAQSIGVDAISVVGYECGGHPGMGGVGTFVLTNEASRTLNIPVIAGGGVVDGRSIAAALALGADAVVMGTRFLASQEAAISQNHKEWLLQATEKSTVLIQKSIHNMMRVANNAAAQTCLDLESKGTPLSELMPVISGKKGKLAYETGNIDDGIFPVGIACSLIKNIKPVSEIMQELIIEMEETFRRFSL